MKLYSCQLLIATLINEGNAKNASNCEEFYEFLVISYSAESRRGKDPWRAAVPAVSTLTAVMILKVRATFWEALCTKIRCRVDVSYNPGIACFRK